LRWDYHFVILHCIIFTLRSNSRICNMTHESEYIKRFLYLIKSHIYIKYTCTIYLKILLISCAAVSRITWISIRQPSSDSKRYRLSNPIFENLWFVNRMFLQAVNIFNPVLLYDSYLLVTKFARDTSILAREKGRKKYFAKAACNISNALLNIVTTKNLTM